MAHYRLMDGVSGRPGVGSTGTQPPAAGTAFSGSYGAGIVFEITSDAWFEGYWWYVPATGGQTTTGQTFALWQVTGANSGSFVSGTLVTAGTLSTGWNFIALATPIPLAKGIPYNATTAYTSTTGFPKTASQFGSGNPYAAGITNGPLKAYSSLTGSAPVTANWLAQQPFQTGNANASLQMANTNDADDLLWMDCQVTDVAPVGATYRIWPNMPVPAGTNVPSTSTNYTLCHQFSLSQNMVLEKLWFYSPPTSNVLPSRCGIFSVSGQAPVTGTDNTSPSWLLPGGGAASAGAGWVYCDYSGANITLSGSTQYKAYTFQSVSTNKWLAVTTQYFTTGLGSAGVTWGALTIPNETNAVDANITIGATGHGQCSFLQSSTFGYVNQSSVGENAWIDVELAPPAATSVSVSDFAGSVESFSITANVSVTDNAGGAEAEVPGATLGVSELAAAVEAFSVSVSVPLSDFAGMVESFGITASVSLSDVAAGLPVLSTAQVIATGLNTLVTIMVSSLTILTSSFTSSCASGQPFQGNVRQLAFDSWNYMYPS